MIFWQAFLFGVSLRAKICLAMVFPPSPNIGVMPAAFLSAFFPSYSNREPQHIEGAVSLASAFRLRRLLAITGWHCYCICHGPQKRCAEYAGQIHGNAFCF